MGPYSGGKLNDYDPGYRPRNSLISLWIQLHPCLALTVSLVPPTEGPWRSHACLCHRKQTQTYFMRPEYSDIKLDGALQEKNTPDKHICKNSQQNIANQIQ